MTKRAWRTLTAVAVWMGLSLAAACKSPGAPPSAEKPKHFARAGEAAGAVPLPSLPPFEAGSAARGKALVGEFECNRCHAGTGLTAPKLERDCVGCHEQ